MQRKRCIYVSLLFLSGAQFSPSDVQLKLSQKSVPNRAKGYQNITSILSSLLNNNVDTPSVNIRRNTFLDSQEKNDIDYVYGINSVCSVLLKNERIIDSAIINRNIKMNKKNRKESYKYIFDRLKERNIPINSRSKKEMDQLIGGFPHNDIILKTHYRTMKKCKDFIKDHMVKTKQNNIYVCLHDIDTPILHSSVGSSEFLEFFHVNNMLNFMDNMKNCGFQIFSTCCRRNESTMKKPLEELKNVKIKSNDKVLVILGNESKGLSDEIINKSDVCIYINGKSNEESYADGSKQNSNFSLDSLNVNNACAVILYHLTLHLR
ncbi:rRNA methylase [Plasmodium gonderi]|uniref:rRNA methyltransferase 1, mitochondrial n=1 Tax=Plasmodium gonderi TaxID=77519 RepID=A0A1Y1JDY4_PLAGO|nr:rRNA methylase [Plasmodium gonderi]GAW79427.1 rRNA methylase [Plasmodium gonderi]